MKIRQVISRLLVSIKTNIFKRAAFVAGVAILFLPIIYTSCDAETGLGEALDLVPPRLSITTPQSGNYTNTIFTITGKVSDKGKGIKSVTIEELGKDGNFHKIAVHPVIKGGTWTCELDFSVGNKGAGDTYSELDCDHKMEGTKILKATATDKGGNVGATSIKQLLLFVDKTPPTTDAWYIDRQINGITYSLVSDPTDLAILKLGEPDNKDAAQNVKFSIHGTMNDTMGVQYVDITLYELDQDDKGNLVVDKNGEYKTTQIGDITSGKIEIGTDSNYYTPEFIITHDDLVKLNPTLSTGKHYIQVRYYAEDVVTDPAPNATAKEGIPIGYFIWWPESDKPHIELFDKSVLDKDGDGNLTEPLVGVNSATYNVKSTFMTNVFDDDELNTVCYGFIDESEYNSLPRAEAGSNTYLDWDKIIDNINNYSYDSDDDKGNGRVFKREYGKEGERDKQVSIYTGDSPGRMHFVSYVTGGGSSLYDEKGDPIKAYNVRDLIVNVIDANAPLIIISSPQTNTIPNVTMKSDNSVAEFTITGKVIDTAGVDYVDFVWVPDSYVKSVAGDNTDVSSITADSIAKDYLYSRNGYQNNHRTEVLTDSGISMWSCNIQGGQPNTTLTRPVSSEQSEGFKEQTFTITMDLLHDFGGKDGAKVAKLFGVLATRGNGSSSRVSTTDDGTVATYAAYMLQGDTTPPVIVTINPSDGAKITAGDPVNIEFYAYKENGMYVDPESYVVQLVDKTTKKPIDNFSPYATRKPNGTVTVKISDTDSIDYVTQKWQVPNDKVGDGSHPDTAASGTLVGDSGAFPTFYFKAADILGNESELTRYMGFGEKSYLKSITTPHSNDTTFGIDKKITFNAVFTGNVTVGSPDNLLLKLSGITGDSDPYATVESSGGTSIVFSYTVKAGTTSSAVNVVNVADASSSMTGGGCPFVTKDGTSVADAIKADVLFNTLLNENIVVNSDAGAKQKVLKIDGTRPKITGVAVTSNGVISGTKAYCKEGRDINVELTLDKTCYVTGKPNFILNSGSEKYTIPYVTAKRAGGVTTVTFTKKVAAADTNGALTIGDSYISDNDLNCIANSVGNSMDGSIVGVTVDYAKQIIIDTVAPGVPNIICTPTYSPNSSGVMITNNNITCNVTKTETGAAVSISNDGGTAWSTGSTSALSVDGSYKVCAKQADIAGNESTVSAPCNIELVKGFPAYSIDCVNPDGYYKAGSTIKFRVSFDRAVTGSNSAVLSITGGGATKLTTTSFSKIKTLEFEYTVKSTDDFTINVATSGLTLTGFADDYGNTWSANTQTCARPDVHCDGVAPTITAVTHTAGNSAKVTLTFSEKVNKGSGYITLRQRGKTGVSSGAGSVWVLPSVLSVSEFNTIYNNAGSSKSKLIARDDNGNDIIDEETNDNDSANAYYHGSGQGVGPYIKTTHGILSDGTPDITTKYVLKFDIDPAANSNTKIDCKQTVKTALGISLSVNELRGAFEDAGYNKRVIDVTDGKVVMGTSGTGASAVSTATITFPSSLTGVADLEDGRYWEVAVSNGAFSDNTGNGFGDGVTTGGGVTVDLANKEIVFNGDSYCFMSAGTAAPFVRVDRYSYGLGINQGSAASTGAILSDKTALAAPTGNVRVRIDSQTPGAVIHYEKSNTVNKAGTDAANGVLVIDKWDAAKNLTFYTSYTDSATMPTRPTATASSTSYSSPFIVSTMASGIQSSVTYISAVATGGSATSGVGVEGIFGTVMEFKTPHGGPATYGVHGGTSISGFGENAQVSGFPLREQKIGTPYVRRCYKSSGDFYWVSFEIMCKASAGGRGSDWGRVNGPIYPGHFTHCTGLWTWDQNK